MNIIISPSNQMSNIGLYENSNECVACENISKILTNKLKECGYNADYFTKATKISDRCDTVNKIQPDLYLIIHTNASSNQLAKGCEAYVRENDVVSRNIANQLVNNISRDLPTNKRAIKNAEYLELKSISKLIPTVYLECDFHTNREAVQILQYEPQRVATIICDTIKEIMTVEPVATINIDDVINKLQEAIKMLEDIK